MKHSFRICPVFIFGLSLRFFDYTSSVTRTKVLVSIPRVVDDFQFPELLSYIIKLEIVPCG